MLAGGATSRALHTWSAGPKIAYVFHVCLSVGLCFPTYHIHNNYVTYTVVM